MNTRWWVPYAFLAPALLGLALFRFTPIGIAMAGSLFGETIRGDTVFQGFKNYRELIDDPTFWGALSITLIFNLIVNPLQVFLAFVLAMLVRRPGRFIDVFRAAFLLPMTVSIAITSVLWNILLDPTLGPVNGFLRWLGLSAQPFFRSPDQALPTLIAVVSWKGVGYWMVFLLAGLLAIPKELDEAAGLDGATAWQRLRYVTLPMMRRPLAFVLVADTAANFLLFAPVYVITHGGPNGATHLLMFEAYQSAFAFLNHGRSLAISTVILLIILVTALFEMRLFRQREGEA
ncbi:carbohydrate ABC transporter permease [Phreatobacter sp. AB_2022a]|uniref:carbohydrate ABC transporter permease n=1 Tax=Phreatobacter sp. AB_2022a TaxID=3003134 RepID=UPI002286D47A|nr:sugar ABC transporter permease [Phreatobacter sp. AB_2022a]MCZ0734146.1 sugar ABC transporter permease [Phreatobacter sp. AB_2022a]